MNPAVGEGFRVGGGGAFRTFLSLSDAAKNLSKSSYFQRKAGGVMPGTREREGK